MARVVRQSIDPVALAQAAHRSPLINSELNDISGEINHRAAEIFASRQLTSNEIRTSETTPPKYLVSFHVRRIEDGAGAYHYEARNSDPAATWVEWGAHAGGQTLVLKYRPMGLAMDAVSD
jgi:hypothetical protein